MPNSADLEPLRKGPFAAAISKLEELLAHSGPVFLLGAGSSKCAGLPLTSELTARLVELESLASSTRVLLSALQDGFKGSKSANIEDYLSELIDQIAISGRRSAKGATSSKLEIEGKTYAADELRSAVEDVKEGIAKIIGEQSPTEMHQRFVRSIHRPARPGKQSQTSVVDYLILNYDTLIEDALGLERIPFSDGMEGGGTAWWSPPALDRSGISARVLKLHGSASWCQLPGDSMPRRLGGHTRAAEGTQKRIMIWPASTKYQETQLDPFAQMMARARKALRPAMDTQRVLLTCGYSFGDSHINSEIDAALRETDGRLTLVVFWSEKEPCECLSSWLSDERLRDQVLVFGKGGFSHGSKTEPSAADLPWWKFETVTRLLEGER